MYVCVCAAVPESEWRRACEASGGNWQEAAVLTGAGACCGCCRSFLAATQPALDDRAAPVPLALA